VSVADDPIDTVKNNCVINLSPDRSRVYKKASTMLKPGVGIMVSDVVAATS